MKTIQQQHTRNIMWSTTEAVVFQSLLLFHQYLLFHVAGPAQYGLIGALFGCLYLAVKTIDLGLNKIIAAFYLDYSQDKKATRSFFIKEMIPNAIAYLTLIGICVWYREWTSTKVELPVVIMIMFLIITESIKLTTKRILQLSHHFRHVAFFEISLIMCYQIAVWSWYYYHKTLSLNIIFGAFLVTAALETTGFCILAYQWYSRLADQNKQEHTIDRLLINKNRLFSFFHSMGRQMLSANALIPVFAYSFGLESAAVLKLASYATHSITSVVEKIIEPSSAVLFAHTKNESAEAQQSIFSFASSALYSLLACISIFVIINGPKLISLSHVTNMTIITCVIAYFLIHVTESFFIVIEKFYIAHNRSEFLLVNTAFNTIIALMTFLYSVSPSTVLITLLFSRIALFGVSFLILSLFWNIRHKVTIQSWHIVASIIGSLIFFVAV